MKMPISEIIDRYTITLLKSERTEEDVSDELKAYQEEIANYKELATDGEKCNDFIVRLKHANGIIWDLEAEGGRLEGNDTRQRLEKIGRIALSVRRWNKTRNGIKAEIVETFHEGFKEIKINYTKHDYGMSGRDISDIDDRHS